MTDERGTTKDSMIDPDWKAGQAASADASPAAAAHEAADEESHEADHQHHEGENMNSKMVVIKEGEAEVALAYLADKAGEIKMEEANLKCVCCMDDDIVHKHPTTGEVIDFAHFSAGSFIHHFAMGWLNEDQLTEIAGQFDIFSSHVNCGAAKIVFDELQGNADARAHFVRLFAGKGATAEQTLAAEQKLAGILANPEDPDALGKAYSQAIADLAGVKYEHLAVDRVVEHGHPGHSAAICIYDMANLFHGPNMEAGGAYVIDSTVDVLRAGFTVEDAVREAVTYGPLAEKIAHGGHSHVPGDAIFSLLVVADQEDAELAQKIVSAVQEKIDTEGLQGKLQVMYFDKATVQAEADKRKAA